MKHVKNTCLHIAELVGGTVLLVLGLDGMMNIHGNGGFLGVKQRSSSVSHSQSSSTRGGGAIADVVRAGALPKLIRSPGTRTMVLFFSPNCSHCTNLAPEWNKFLDRSLQDRGLLVVAINVDTETKENQRWLTKMAEAISNLPNIEGYPTILKLEGKNYARTYTGNRSSDDLLRFAQTHGA